MVWRGLMGSAVGGELALLVGIRELRLWRSGTAWVIIGTLG